MLSGTRHALVGLLTVIDSILSLLLHLRRVTLANLFSLQFRHVHMQINCNNFERQDKGGTIAYFTVICLVTGPLSRSEAKVILF